jgi:hypothetical protein
VGEWSGLLLCSFIGRSRIRYYVHFGKCLNKLQPLPFATFPDHIYYYSDIDSYILAHLWNWGEKKKKKKSLSIAGNGPLDVQPLRQSPRRLFCCNHEDVKIKTLQPNIKIKNEEYSTKFCKGMAVTGHFTDTEIRFKKRKCKQLIFNTKKNIV